MRVWYTFMDMIKSHANLKESIFFILKLSVLINRPREFWPIVIVSFFTINNKLEKQLKE